MDFVLRKIILIKDEIRAEKRRVPRRKIESRKRASLVEDGESVNG